MKRMKKTSFITMSASIAVLYVTLTYLTGVFGLANGAIQCRLSEALLVLPMFTPAAIPGLFVGCVLANFLTGCMVADVVFGSVATLIGAVGAYLLRSRHPCVATCINVISNMVIVPLVLKLAYGLDAGILYFVATVGIGEIISCTVLGALLYKILCKHRKILFRQ